MLQLPVQHVGTSTLPTQGIISLHCTFANLSDEKNLAFLYVLGPFGRARQEESSRPPATLRVVPALACLFRIDHMVCPRARNGYGQWQEGPNEERGICIITN